MAAEGGSVLRYGLREDTLSSALGGFLREVCPPSRARREEGRDLAMRKEDNS